MRESPIEISTVLAIRDAGLRLLAVNAYTAYRASMSGSTPALRELFRELSNPLPGDLVLEVTTLRRSDFDPVTSMGRLVKAEVKDDDVTHTIALVFGNGEELTWGNARFCKIKETL